MRNKFLVFKLDGTIDVIRFGWIVKFIFQFELIIFSILFFLKNFIDGSIVMHVWIFKLFGGFLD